MLSDEEIAEIKKGIEERAHRSHTLGFNIDEHEFILKFIKDLQSTRQDLRELCKAVMVDCEFAKREKNAKHIDVVAYELEKKYGWRQP